jgi:hypothetical protein
MNLKRQPNFSVSAMTRKNTTSEIIFALRKGRSSVLRELQRGQLLF